MVNPQGDLFVWKIQKRIDALCEKEFAYQKL